MDEIKELEEEIKEAIDAINSMQNISGENIRVNLNRAKSKAINALDVNILNMDTVELLQRMVPLEEEIKKYREFNVYAKNIS